VDPKVCKCYLLRLSGGDYVGMTQMLMRDRLRFHRRAKSFIGCAIRKYGEPTVLFLGFGTRVEMAAQERREIANRKPRYNLTEGGDGFSSEEMRQFWEDPRFQTKAKVGMHKHPRGKPSSAEQTKMTQRLVQYNKSEAGRRQQSLRMSQFWSDPINRLAHGNKIRKHGSV
jgi:hypothetical protein